MGADMNRRVLRASEQVTIGGRAYTLVCDMNTLADLEDITEENAFDLIDKIMAGDLSAKRLRALMWAQLQEHHPDVNLRAAGQLVSEDLESCFAAVRAALEKAFPRPTPPEADAGNPPAPEVPSAA
jgi:hypothetical protein